MPRAAVRFCGGCDPDYDRVEYFRAVQAAAGDKIEWVGPEEAGPDRLLVICGCATACPVEKLRAEGLTGFIGLTSSARPPEEIAAALQGGRDDQDQG